MLDYQLFILFKLLANCYIILQLVAKISSKQELKAQIGLLK